MSCFHKGIDVCEELIRIPIPLSYTRLTSRFLVLWHLTFPIILRDDCHWVVVPATFISEASLFCIEEVGVIIEEPFPMLALDELCNLVCPNIQEAVAKDKAIQAHLVAKKKIRPLREHSTEGDDTRYGFISHLMAALSDKQIKAFIDTMLQKAESIDELLSVLQKSALSIIIFSENFAESPWCFDEVELIAQSMAQFGHRALPVFYKIGWSDVAGGPGSYSFTILEKLIPSSEDGKRWKDALEAVANCAGHTYQANQIESEFIKRIVEDVQKLLIDMSPSIKSNNLVGIGSRVWEVEQLLTMDVLDKTRIIGLWGMGGVGKTTLAKACYERIVSSTNEFKHHFIRNINENCTRQLGVEGMVNELYSKLLSETTLSLEDLDSNYRRSRLSRLKVFIVFDDVETPCQLEYLLLGDISNLNKLFAMGSRIIVTTRNKKVLQNAMAKIYGVECLNDDESLQLLSLHAFRQHHPPDHWMLLSRLATSYCKGNSLALRVLGGALFGEDINYWRSFLSGLRLIHNPKIHDILMKSYNKLGVDEKRLFLDVACLHSSIARSSLVDYMAIIHSSTYAKVKDLIDKSLLMCISSKDGEQIEVHDLLKEMAWDIVNEEPKLGKRTRLAYPEDIHKLLTTQKVKIWAKFVSKFLRGIEMVLPRRKRRKVANTHWKGNFAMEEDRRTEGISLDLSKAREMHLEVNAFEGMNSLTFLKIYLPESLWSDYSSLRDPAEKKIHLPYGLDSLPNGLRWLHWDAYPSKSLPSRFYPQNLIHLTIRDSPIKICWEGSDEPTLVNLMELDLSNCVNLNVIPDLSRSLKLEELLLRQCKSLVEVPSNVQYLDKLVTLDLGYCGNLEHLPSKLNSKFLKHVRIDHCPNVEHCPEINSGELVELNLDGTPILELPSAIYRVKQDGILRLYGESITNFPSISASLQEFVLVDTAMEEINSYDQHTYSELFPKFAKLMLFFNCQLKSLPKNIWNMVSFSLFTIGSPLLESLPEILEQVDGLTHLYICNCESLKSLPSSINNLVALEFLCLRDTGIKSLPSCIQELCQLCILDLNYCRSLESIPSNIHKLSQLFNLSLRGCRSLLSLPELPPNLVDLDVGECRSLQALPINASKLTWVHLLFYDCPQLDMTVSDEILANYLVYASSSNFYFSESVLQYSGSEIPDWFVYKSVKDKDNSCMMVQLPPANCTSSEQLIKGIAFGVVWSSNAFNFWPILKCECNFGTIIVASWSCGPSTPDPWYGTNSSDQVLLWFYKKSSGETEGREEGEAWYVKYAGHSLSFRFYADSDYEDIKLLKYKIKRCGVSLVY